MSDYKTNNEYLKTIAGDESTDYHCNNYYLKQIAENGGSGGGADNSVNDFKMLGWTVPKECSIQNYIDSDGVFHQRVGRVSLKNQTWTTDGIGKGNITVYRFPIPTNCKTYSNNAKWNIYVKGYTTRGLVTNYVDDVATTDMSVGGRNAGGNYIEFSTTVYDSADAFKTYMDSSELYLYYELETEITKSVDGNEIVEEISNVESDVISTTYGNVTCKKVNGIVSIYYVGNSAMIPQGAWTSIGTIPEKYRPSIDHIDTPLTLGAASDIRANWRIKSSGEMSFYGFVNCNYANAVATFVK